jgi:uncharacterized membrane protein YdjX (TVP38/TMEM64 family)
MTAAAQPLTTNRTFGVSLNPAALAAAGRVALLLAVPPAAWLARQPLAALVDLIKDREALAQMAHHLGPWGPLALMLTIGLQVTFAVLPGHVLMLAGGYLYGFVPGVLITWISTVAASQVNFLLARRYGLPLVYRLCPRPLVDRWEGVVKDKGFVFFLMTLVLPIFPSDLMCYLAGFSKLTPRQYAVVNMLGHLPCAIGMSLVGSGLLVVSLSPAGYVLLGGLCVAALGLWRRYGRALENRFFPAVESEA